MASEPMRPPRVRFVTPLLLLLGGWQLQGQGIQTVVAMMQPDSQRFI